MQVEQRVSQRAREFAKKFVGCDCRICVEKRVSILMEFEQTAPSVLAESTSNDCLLVAEAVRERCAGVADGFAKTWDLGGPGDTKAGIIASAIRSLDLSGFTDGWQDIATAPKDGTGVLITGGTFDNSMSMAGSCPYNAVTIAHYYDGAWQGENSGGHDEYYWHEPTLWMPLPAPPAVTDLSGVGVG